jgi:HJR/Mrr/RecB family endonuclease
VKSIFISYSRADAPKAILLAHELAKQGAKVMRPDELAASAEWHAEVLSAIRRCSVLLAFIEEPTPNVMFELGFALGAAKPVLLVGYPESRIPFDVATLPIARFDENDPGSLLTISEWISEATGTDVTPTQPFMDVRTRLERMRRDPEYLDQVSPRDLESSVLAFLQELGFIAEQMPPNHDGGYDILAKNPQGSVLAVIEVKKHQHNGVLGLAQVRDLVGALTLADAPCAILVTTGRFSASARDMAKRAPRPVLLMTLDELVTSTQESIISACR